MPIHSVLKLERLTNNTRRHCQICVGMDCAARLHPIFSSLAFSFSSSRRPSFPAVSRSLAGSPLTARFASTNRSGAHPVPVVAQARRGSSLKEVEVASRNQRWFSSSCFQFLLKFLSFLSNSDHFVSMDVVFSAGDFQFEIPLKVVKYPDPLLRAKNKRIDSFDDNLKKLVHEMFDVMYKWVFVNRSLVL